MKYDEETKHFKLNSKKSFPAEHAVIGISCNLPIIFQGYQALVWQTFTTEERKEIAEYMTQLWKEWAK